MAGTHLPAIFVRKLARTRAFESGTAFAFVPAVVPFRFRIAQAVLAVVIGFTALTAVGLTAPADAAFSIVVRPVFVTLGIDVDVKVWSTHLHFGWSALPAAPASTKPAPDQF
jgi:hypothetical protein